MSDGAEYRALKTELEVMRRQLAMVMEKTGITLQEVDDSELDAVLDQATATRDYTLIKDYLKRKKSRRAA